MDIYGRRLFFVCLFVCVCVCVCVCVLVGGVQHKGFLLLGLMFPALGRSGFRA